MGRPLKNIRWTAAFAVQAGSRLLLDVKSLSNDEHDLSPSQRVAFLAISVGLVIMAGLMSGLTLGLMSMDLVELEVLKRSGTATEQMYAAAIMPIVSNQHFLLVTLLLCNAGAMEALPLFLDRLADPVTAILISVTAVLVFGEVLPQAVCSRYGLAIGYYCAWLVRGLMALTSPISWPIGKLLDFLLGHEHRALFRRGQLKALVDIHGASEGLGGNLSEDEIKVICGALDLTNKTARKSMTPLNKVFMLPANARLNRSTMRSILASGHSRIPVYAGGDRSNIIGLILVKELLQYKTHQEVPVSDVRMRSLPRLPADTPMYDMLKLFQTGRSHMVVLTDTPATARAAAVAAAAAAEAAAIIAAAEAAEIGNEGDNGSRGRKKRKERHQFHSPLLQPIPTDDHHSDCSAEYQLAPATGGAWIAGNSEQQQGRVAADSVFSALYPEQQNSEPPDFTEPTQQPGSFLTAPDGIASPGGSRTPLDAFLRQQELVAGMPGGLDRSVALDSAAGRTPGSRSVLRDTSGTVGRSVSFNERAPASDNAAGFSGPSKSSSTADPVVSSDKGSAEEIRQQSSNSRGSQHSRSMSGPLPSSMNPLLMGGVTLPQDGIEGVAVPIGIITIEDVIEELMQAEIVDETDLFIDNERLVAVNAAELALSLPAQLRLALAPMPARGVNPAVGAAAARVTVRKLIKQQSSGTLVAPTAGLASVNSAGGSTAAGTASAQGKAGNATSAVMRPKASGDPGAVTATVLQRGQVGNAQGAAGQGSMGSGVVGAVSASLAAAAAAVTGATSSGARGRSADRQPLLYGNERSAPSARPESDYDS